MIHNIHSELPSQSYKKDAYLSIKTTQFTARFTPEQANHIRVALQLAGWTFWQSWPVIFTIQDRHYSLCPLAFLSYLLNDLSCCILSSRYKTARACFSKSRPRIPPGMLSRNFYNPKHTSYHLTPSKNRKESNICKFLGAPCYLHFSQKCHCILIMVKNWNVYCLQAYSNKFKLAFGDME